MTLALRRRATMPSSSRLRPERVALPELNNTSPSTLARPPMGFWSGPPPGP